jgi:hypothetical protein
MAIEGEKFFTFAELKDRMSETQILRVFDDEQIGEENDAAVNQIIARTNAAVRLNASKNYPGQVAEGITPSTVHVDLKALALDYAVAATKNRFKTLFKGENVVEELDRAEKALGGLALGKVHLAGVGGATNEIATVRSGITVGGSTTRTFDSFGGF